MMTAVLSIPEMQTPGPLLLSAEARRLDAVAQLDQPRRAELGQFMTGPAVASFMASFFEIPSGPARLLDPGAGVGSLAAAVIERFQREAGGEFSVTAVELDDALVDRLQDTLDELSSAFGVCTELVPAEFIDWG